MKAILVIIAIIGFFSGMYWQVELPEVAQYPHVIEKPQADNISLNH